MDPKLKILVVDDMTTMRKLVIKACKDMGFTDISEAADGAKAWELCLNANPAFDLVISDWNMPNCTGLDFLKRVRADGRLKGTPFMLLTAESEASQVSEAIKAGVNNYVVKPFTGEGLKEKVNETLKKAGR